MTQILFYFTSLKTNNRCIYYLILQCRIDTISLLEIKQDKYFPINKVRQKIIQIYMCIIFPTILSYIN